MTLAEVQRLAEYIIDGEHICPVCDEPVLHDGNADCCSEACLTEALERQHEEWCERYYGGDA